MGLFRHLRFHEFMNCLKSVRIIIKRSCASLAQVSMSETFVEVASRDAKDLSRLADATLDSATIF